MGPDEDYNEGVAFCEGIFDVVRLLTIGGFSRRGKSAQEAGHPGKCTGDKVAVRIAGWLF
jgi:hypothetical protein